MVVGTIREREVSNLNLYAPNEYDQNFFKEVANIIADNAKGMIVGGDFNAIQDGELEHQLREDLKLKKNKTKNSTQ